MIRFVRATAVLAALLPSTALAAQEPRLLPNGWFYGEAGNYCMAIRETRANGPRLTMRLAKWNDLSDSLILWAPGLAALDPEAEGDAHRIEIRIDGRPIPLLPSIFTLEGYDGRPGSTWRIGIRQQPFIAALRTARTLEIRRAGTRIISFPVARSTGMAGQMAECVRRPPSLGRQR